MHLIYTYEYPCMSIYKSHICHFSLYLVIKWFIEALTFRIYANGWLNFIFLSDGGLQIFMNWDKICSSSFYRIVSWEIKCIKVLLSGTCQYIFSLIKCIFKELSIPCISSRSLLYFPLNLFAYKQKHTLKVNFSVEIVGAVPLHIMQCEFYGLSDRWQVIKIIILTEILHQIYTFSQLMDVVRQLYMQNKISF